MPSTRAAWFDGPGTTYFYGVLAIFGCIFSYLPGLGGPFLFDDIAVLSQLGAAGGITDWPTLRAFVLGGETGPTGRPLAQLSFLIDATTWPADPQPFKRTNLAIHIVTGIVLFRLTHRILQVSVFQEGVARRLAVVAAGVWLLHPFLVSTTLYVVQRMAQLSTLFVFCGLLSYVVARLQLERSNVRAHVLMTISLVLFTLLATLSKENGALLPLLVGVLEFTIFARRRASGDRPNDIWTAVFILIPSALVILYLLSLAFSGRWLTPNPMRGVSIYERLLTEARILFDYISHWIAPRAYTNGVFQDHYEASRGVLKPATTLLAVLAHLTILVTAILWRRRWPIGAFAVLFFYASHLLESTFVNLELYFEHRNYLACAFLLLPVIALFQQRAPRWASIACFPLLLTALAAFTWNKTQVWSGYESLVTTAAISVPTSARAQQQYSQLLFNRGDYALANAVVDNAIGRLPDAQSLRLHKAIIACEQGLDSQTEFDGLIQSAAKQPFDVRLFDYYQTFLVTVASGKCSSLNLDHVRDLFVSMERLPQNLRRDSARYRQLKFLSASTEALAGRPTVAAVKFRQSLDPLPTASRAMLMAAIMASNNFLYEASVFSDIALSLVSEEASGELIENDVLDFRARLRREIENRAHLSE